MFLPHTLWGSYELAVLIKILLAALVGGAIGLEREKHGRPAGLRTHLLVSVGACLMMIISEAFFLKYGGFDGQTTPLRLDPSRVAAQIVTGIGFLGAGVIIKEGLSIRGLTTAASLWLVAGLGMAFGAGIVGPGIIAAGVALFGLIALKRLEPIIRKDRYLHLIVTAGTSPDIYPELERVFAEKNLRIHDIGSTYDLQHQSVVYRFIITQHRQRIGRELTAAIATIPGITKITFE
ncbi:MgtC/SapB family protein [Geoalkalibacter sp.]|uniref:MgtC/SapB family protein n=1 Tax=Geoalkalibacter sp. TaxID=3041440 RepID=UPI00272DF577|nr:MgtC/SapB family protein [Geoalkalibacter sp.]